MEGNTTGARLYVVLFQRDGNFEVECAGCLDGRHLVARWLENMGFNIFASLATHGFETCKNGKVVRNLSNCCLHGNGHSMHTLMMCIFSTSC